jgi:membrane protein DedA with SNARE-associated domain
MQHLLIDHTYGLLFFALLLGGETILIPAVYLALIGKLEILPLAGVACCATILSDSAWYFAGRLLPVQMINRLPFGKRWPRVAAHASGLFQNHRLKAVFVSKFLYGTRIAVQILAGLTRLQYYRYLLVNTASVLLWLGLILLLGLGVARSADTLHLGVHRAYLLLGLFIPILLISRLAVRHLATRMLSMNGSGGNRSVQRARLVSAIIPAFNEAETVSGVVRALEAHPLVDDIIVVDDGSTDLTAERARETSATVIKLESNQGKAPAMAKGVEVARHETIFFLDADLHGLTSETIDALVNPVISGKYDMFVAIRDRRQSLLNKIVYFSPILGGERVLKKSIWSQVPGWCVKSFQIEISLNYFAKRSGGKMGFELMPGLTHIKKETKRGFWRGVLARVRMYAELVAIAFKLYIVWSIASLFSRNWRMRQPACPPS